MERIYLSLGSNIGDRAGNISRAMGALAAHGVKVTRQSSLYETEPVEMTEQEWFLNSVVEAETNLQPDELMAALLAIEREMGRERRVPKGPRVIDLDVLLYGARVVHTTGVEIPHPRMAQRRFVLEPLAEIAPEVWHPLLQRTAAELLESVNDSSVVRKARL